MIDDLHKRHPIRRGSLPLEDVAHLPGMALEHRTEPHPLCESNFGLHWPCIGCQLLHDCPWRQSITAMVADNGRQCKHCKFRKLSWSRAELMLRPKVSAMGRRRNSRNGCGSTNLPSDCAIVLQSSKRLERESEGPIGVRTATWVSTDFATPIHHL